VTYEAYVVSGPSTRPQVDSALVGQINPALRAAYGVGPDTAAQLLVTAGTNTHRLRTEASFAALCGAAPVPASSGKIICHRFSRGGDRAANNALYRIALVRMSAHAQTRDYVQRQDANGRTNKRFCGFGVVVFAAVPDGQQPHPGGQLGGTSMTSMPSVRSRLVSGAHH
jgi:Transposase IS116/IS110/IS902 family